MVLVSSDGLIADAQRQGRQRVTAVILDADRTERAYRRLASMWRALAEEHDGAWWQRASLRARAAWSIGRADELRRLRDRLYRVMDTYLGGAEGRVTDGLGAVQAGVLVLAGVAIASLSGASAFIADRWRDVEVERAKAAEMAALSTALEAAETPEERRKVLGIAQTIAESRPGDSSDSGAKLALLLVAGLLVAVELRRRGRI